MTRTLTSLAALALVAALSFGTEAMAGPAQSYMYRQQGAEGACRPPLKFAAGACVRQCPAGYRDTGRTCRFKSMRRLVGERRL